MGNEVDQKGSLVAQDKLRFDFSSRVRVDDSLRILNNP
jgi:alanyl-tRNA synthetase